MIDVARHIDLAVEVGLLGEQGERVAVEDDLDIGKPTFEIPAEVAGNIRWYRALLAEDDADLCRLVEPLGEPRPIDEFLFA
jgi:hypothetical protein